MAGGHSVQLDPESPALWEVSLRSDHRVLRRMAKKRKKFFSRQTEASRVKAEIIAKYFPGWATVIKSWAKTRMAYIDLYAGCGRYDDGSESTPLLVLRHAIADPIVGKMLVTIFNDKDHANALRTEIEALPGVEKLKYKPWSTPTRWGTTPRSSSRRRRLSRRWRCSIRGATRD